MEFYDQSTSTNTTLGSDLSATASEIMGACKNALNVIRHINEEIIKSLYKAQGLDQESYILIIGTDLADALAITETTIPCSMKDNVKINKYINGSECYFVKKVLDIVEPSKKTPYCGFKL